MSEWVKDLPSPLSFPLYISLLFYISWKNISKILKFLFLFSPLWTMVSSSLKTNLLMFLTLNFFVVTMFFLNYLTVSVSLLNIQRLKFFILADLKTSLTCLFWTFPHLEDQYYDPKNPGSTWVSSSITSSISTSILTTTLTRLYQPSSV